MLGLLSGLVILLGLLRLGGFVLRRLFGFRVGAGVLLRFRLLGSLAGPAVLDALRDRAASGVQALDGVVHDDQSDGGLASGLDAFVVDETQHDLPRFV